MSVRIVAGRRPDRSSIVVRINSAERYGALYITTDRTHTETCHETESTSDLSVIPPTSAVDIVSIDCAFKRARHWHRLTSATLIASRLVCGAAHLGRS